MYWISRRLLTSAFVLVLMGGLVPSLAHAQLDAEETPANGQPAPPPVATPKLALKSPRATLQTFLRSMKKGDTDKAIECLDLSHLNRDAVKAGGPTIAHQVKVAIDQVVGLRADDQPLAWEVVPEDNEYPEPFTLDVILGAKERANELVLVRGEDANWRFSAETCKAAESIFNDLAESGKLVDKNESNNKLPFDMRLRSWFPEKLRRAHLLLPDYQWICLLLLIFVGLVGDLLTRHLLTWIVDRRFAEAADGTKADTTEKVWRPLGRLVNAAIWYYGTKLIGLPLAALNVLLIILKLFTIVAAVWTAFALTDIVCSYWQKRAMRTATKFDDLLVPLVSKTLKLFATCLGLLTTAQTFDLPVMGLIGGLGIGGAALALASKDAVANFFGSVTVLFDRPFEVGDWIITDGAEGTVETVGFRSTRIRTFYNSMITLPNSLLTTSVVDNMGRRRFRRIKTTIGVQYDTTPEQLDAFCEGIRELIRRHPYTRKDYYHVYFNDFGPSALNIMLYCFVACPDWSIELRERHRLLADILRLAGELGVQFAFPTRTVHLFSEQSSAEHPNIETPTEKGRQLAEDIAGSGTDEIPGPVQF